MLILLLFLFYICIYGGSQDSEQEVFPWRLVVQFFCFSKYLCCNLCLRPLHQPGSISASVADVDLVNKRVRNEQLVEDGTLTFLGIAYISHRFKIVDMLSISAIARYVHEYLSP